MKKFILQLLFFISIPTCLVFCTYFIRKKLNAIKLEQISIKYTTLIMGDSHMARLDPTIFKLNSKNIATPGEHYYYTYQKLKQITSNPGFTIKNVIIGVSPINFSPSLQKIFDLRNIEGKSILKKNLMFINLNYNDEYKLIDYLSLNYTYIGIFWPTEWGGFVKSENSFTDDLNINNAIDIHYNKRNLYSLSVQEKYLYKIINLCKQNSIKLFCTSTPVVNKYRIQIPTIYLDKYQSTVKKYNKDATWINFSNLILADSLFADADHLNYLGSKFITTKVDSIITNQ